MNKLFSFFAIFLILSVRAEEQQIYGPLKFRANDAKQQIHEPLKFRIDDAEFREAPRLVKGSHIKVYLPRMPYVYISHAINGALFRPANNERGWEYDLATAYQKIDDQTYEFKLRQGVVFQDGTPFNADAVLSNMEYFSYKPYLFTKFNEVLDHVEKVDDYTVRFYLNQKYGMFLNDVLWLQFYTKTYLEKFGWNGKITAPNLIEPGPYGLGPYILTEGHLEGDRQTPKVELVANPHYWDKRYPKIERVTLYTELSTQEANHLIFYQEGQLDIASIGADKKIEALLSPYAKLVITPSTRTLAIHFNLYSGHPELRKKEVRFALNQAIHQTNLLHFIYRDEGVLAPTSLSPNLPGVKAAMRNIKPYSEVQNPYEPSQQAALKSTLNGLKLTVLTQGLFLYLCKGIEDQWNKVGVTLDIKLLSGEKEVITQLLSTESGKNTYPWDLLIWGDDDWFSLHPWSNFIVYRTTNYWMGPQHWSTLLSDPVLDKYIEELFQTGVEEPGFNETVAQIMQYTYDNAYMVFIPSPHQLWAVNNEVIFTPYQQAILPLWEIGITPLHPSIRSGAYPEERKSSVEITRKNFQ